MHEPLEPSTDKSANGSFEIEKIWNGKQYFVVNSALAIISENTFICALITGLVLATLSDLWL